MAKNQIAAKPGRPVTVGATSFVGAKLPPALVDRIDAWAKARGLGRSEAMRQLVEKGLGRPRREKASL